MVNYELICTLFVPFNTKQLIINEYYILYRKVTETKKTNTKQLFNQYKAL